MTDRDRAWDAEHHRAALQIITEADRGLRVAEHELKGGRLMDARETVRLVRGLLPPLERAIQRRPVRAEVERLTALIAEVRDAMEDESNLDGWVGNYVRTSTIRRILDGADS